MPTVPTSPPPPQRTKTVSLPSTVKTEVESSAANPGVAHVTISDPIQQTVAQSLQSQYAAKGTIQHDPGRDPFVKPGGP